MKNIRFMSEEEWIDGHKSDIQNVQNILNNLEKDRKIQKIYKRFIKLKNKKNKISYNTDESLSKKFEKDTLLFSYSKKEKINHDNLKLGHDNGQMMFG